LVTTSKQASSKTTCERNENEEIHIEALGINFIHTNGNEENANSTEGFYYYFDVNNLR